jgi:mycofactocin glycosyltransferase
MSANAAPPFVLDASCRVLDDGTCLLGGSPLRLFRLGPAGARVLDALQRGGALPDGHEPLTERLLDAGALHPTPPVGTGPPIGDVTVVIPALAVAPGRLARLVEGCRGVGAVIVVDDASPVPIEPVPGARVHRLTTNAGPGGARNTGLALVDTPLVAFVDADTTPPPGWLDALLPHFADERVALVAPRVRSTGGSGTLARYEQWRSPLDLGGAPARVRAGTRVSYVPAAALVGRVAALREVGDFDGELRFGEDVDLVWRVDEAGWRVRYEPAAEVAHTARPDVRSWIAQRAGYGSSAAPLARRHPGSVAPARLNRWSAIAWVLATVRPPAGLAVAAVTTGMLARKLDAVAHPWRVACRLAGLGHLHAGRILASALTRAWWPGALLAAAFSKRARRVVTIAMVLPPAVAWYRDRPALDPLRAVALHIADDLAYGAGLWRGMGHERSLAAIRPVLSSD